MIRKSITTAYKGPSAATGSRIVASPAAGRAVHPYDHALTADGNHAVAARKLAERLDWPGDWVAGGLPDGRRVWVNTGLGEEFTAFSVERRHRVAK